MRIEDYAGRHAGERCYVIGSGPSLATQDLSGLRDEITFTCNRGHLLFPRMGGPSTYWAIEDALDAEQFHAELAALAGPVKFVPDDLSQDFGDCVRVPFSRDRFDGPEEHPWFSARPPFSWGATVSYFMLQLAAYMGCAEIRLLGHDFRYDDAGIAGGSDIWTIGARDANHFDPSYWPAGSLAFRARPDLMRRAFVSAAVALSARGVRVINMTPGSALDVFETADYAEVACASR